MVQTEEKEKKEAPRKMRFTDGEISMIKNTFKDNEHLIRAIRKVFLQMPLSKVDTEILAGTFKGKKELFALMEKTFNPTLDPDAPLHQLIDLWMSIDIKDKPIEDLMPVFKARKLLIDLLKQQLAELKTFVDGTGGARQIKIESLIDLERYDAKDLYTNITARNTLITHTEAQLSQLLILASKGITEMIGDAMRKKNSSK